MLGPLAEETLRQTMLISGGHLNVFVERGTSIAILVFIVFLLSLPLLRTPIAATSKAALQLVSPRRRSDDSSAADDSDEAAPESDQKSDDREHVG